MKIQEKIVICLTGTFVVVSIAVILYGAPALDSIIVSYIGSGKEHTDKFIPGINQEERAPDYGISINTKVGWQDLGVASNTFMNSGTLTFTAPRDIPTRNIYEIQLYDDDPIENDILERISFSKGESKGSKYSFYVVTGWSLSAGLAFFWATAIGKAILLGITIGVAVIMAFHFNIIDIG